MRLQGIVAAAILRHNDAADDGVRARLGMARPIWLGRRVLALILLVVAFGAFEVGNSPVGLLAAGLFIVLGELEIALARRATSVRHFEATVVAFKLSFAVLVVLAAPATMGATWVAPALLALLIVNSSAFTGWRGLALVTLAAALANIAVVEVAIRGLLGAEPTPRLAASTYATQTRFVIAFLFFPALAATTYLTAQSVGRMRLRLEETVSELRATKGKLESSRDDLERSNRQLNGEVAEQTRALEERNRYLSIINAVSFALAEPMDDLGALERAARLVARLLGVRAAQAFRRDADTGESMHLFVTVAPEDLQAPRLPETVLRQVAESGRPLTSRPDEAEPPPGLPDLGEEYAVVPLVAKGRVLGAFGLIGTGRMAWDDQQRHLLLLVGREMGVALENARLYRGAVDKAAREEVVAEVTRLLDGTRGGHTVEEALRLALEHLGAREAVFIECGESLSVRPLVAAAAGSPWEADLAVLAGYEKSIVGLVTGRPEPLVLGAGGEGPVSDRLAVQGVGTLAIAPIYAMRGAPEAAEEDAPAAAQHALVAIVALVTPVGTPWDESCTQVLRRVASALARRLEADELLALQQRRIRELSALAEIGRTMQSGADVERLLVGFAHALSMLLPYQHAYLALLDEFGEFREVTCFGADGKQVELPAVNAGDSSHRWLSLRTPVAWRRGAEKPPAFLDAGDQAALVVPMRPKGQVLGVVVVGLAGPAADDQARIVEQAVEQLALALDSAALYQQATARASHIQALSNLARIVASVVNLREAFAAFAEEVRWLIPFERAVMLLLDDDEHAIEPYATYPDEGAPSIQVHLAGSAANVAVQAGSAVAIRADDPRYAQLDWSIFGEDVLEVAAVPVRQGSRTAAVFALIHASDGGYTNGDLDALEEVAGLLGVTIERLRLYERAEHSAKHDLMTGLPNYRYLQERLQELRLGISEPGESALLMVDMDNLKVFNDTLGHEAGDRAIEVVAREIRGACRDIDFVARSGGDEFVVVMEGANADSALLVASRIHEALATAHLDVPGAPSRLAVSIGVALAPDDTDSTHDLLHLADEAMYTAKFGGGQRTSMVEGRDEQAVSRRLQTRSTRIIESMNRAALSGATAHELTAVALAQRWASTLVVRSGYPADIAGQVRMLVALEASSRLGAPRNDRDRSTACYFLGRLRADWLASQEEAAMLAVGVLVPSVVSVAWAMMPQPDGLGETAEEALARTVAQYGVVTANPGWTLLVDVIHSDRVERRQNRPAA